MDIINIHILQQIILSNNNKSHPDTLEEDRKPYKMSTTNFVFKLPALKYSEWFADQRSHGIALSQTSEMLMRGVNHVELI